MEQNKNNNYIFPNSMAKKMMKIDLRTQLEASMMAGAFMLIGVCLTILYMILYGEYTTWFKILLGLNGIAGFIILAGFIVTTFQQYSALMEAKSFQEEAKNASKI